MSKGYTKIAVVLDRSGSMGSVKKATIDGFNEFLSGQKAAEGEARITLAQFDDFYDIVYNDTDIQKAPSLTSRTFEPRGMTALYDAVCKTINSLNNEAKDDCSHCAPEKTVFVIITDGGENASKEFTYEQMTKMISHQREKHNWEFVFIGANQDAMATAQRFNIPTVNSITFANNDTSVKSAFAGMSKNLSNYRGGQSVNMSYSIADREAQDEANKG